MTNPADADPTTMLQRSWVHLIVAPCLAILGGIAWVSMMHADRMEQDLATTATGHSIPIEQRPLAPFDLAQERKRLLEASPEHIVIGDSMLWSRLGLNAGEHLNPVSGERFHFITRSGLSPAAVYLVLKNIVQKSGLKPRTVIVLYRDYMLTMPTYRTTGRYRPVLDSLRDGKESVLEDHLRRAWKTHWNVPAAWLDHTLRGDDGSLTFPLQSSYAKRSLEDLAMRAWADSHAEKVQFRQVLDERFSMARLRSDLAAELAEGEQIESDTAARLSEETSFVPAMAMIAKEMGSRLLFYRVKRRPRTDDGITHQSPESIAYARHLREDLSKLGCLSFDETPDPLIKRSQYADGDHLKDSERAGYAHYFYGNLRPLLGPASH